MDFAQPARLGNLLRRYWLALPPACLAIVAATTLLRGSVSGPMWVIVSSGALAGCAALSGQLRHAICHSAITAWTQASAFPSETTCIPWRAVFLLVLLPDALLLLSRGNGIQSGDSRPVVMTVISLTSDGNAELSELVDVYCENHLFTAGSDLPYFLLRRPNGVYSHYPSGMAPFAVPVVLIARTLGADLTDPSVQERLEKAAASLLSAACLSLFFLLALHVVPAAPAYLAAVLLATGSVMYSTVGQALWQHGGVIFWSELLLLTEFRGWRQPTWRTTAVQALACAMMLACRLSSAVIVVAFGAWLFIRSPRRAVALAGFACLAVAPWALINWSIYDSPLGAMAVQTHGTFWSFTNMAAWAGILISPTHGLLVYQPWLVLAASAGLPGVWRNLPHERSALPPGWRWWAAAAIGLHLLLISGWWCWWGGWCWGSRLASEAIPLAALLVLRPLAAVWASRRGRHAVLTLALLSMLLHIPSVWLRQGRWYGGMEASSYAEALWNWSTPPFLYPLHRDDLEQRTSSRRSTRVR